MTAWEKPRVGTAAVNKSDAMTHPESSRSRKALPPALVVEAAKTGIQGSRSGVLPARAATSGVRSSRRDGHTVVFAKDSQTCHRMPLT